MSLYDEVYFGTEITDINTLEEICRQDPILRDLFYLLFDSRIKRVDQGDFDMLVRLVENYLSHKARKI